MGLKDLHIDTFGELRFFNLKLQPAAPFRRVGSVHEIVLGASKDPPNLLLSYTRQCMLVLSPVSHNNSFSCEFVSKSLAKIAIFMGGKMHFCSFLIACGSTFFFG